MNKTWTCCEHCAPHVNAEIAGRDEAIKEAQIVVKWVKRHIDGNVHKFVYTAAEQWLKKYVFPEGKPE